MFAFGFEKAEKEGEEKRSSRSNEGGGNDEEGAPEQKRSRQIAVVAEEIDSACDLALVDGCETDETPIGALRFKVVRLKVRWWEGVVCLGCGSELSPIACNVS